LRGIASSGARTLTLIIGGVLLMQPAVAEESGSEPSVLEEVLTILHATGRIDDAKYQALLDRQRRDVEQRKSAAMAAAPDDPREISGDEAPTSNRGGDLAEVDPEGWSIRWKNGVRIERNDGYFKIRFAGRLENEWAAVGYSDGVAAAVGIGDGRGQVATGTQFRRARISMEGTLFGRLGFKSQYDFADESGGPDNTEFKDMWVSLNDLGPAGDLRIGFAKEPFSLEELTSGKFTTFMERALPNALVPRRATGFQLMNAPLAQRMTWAVGGFRSTDDLGRGFGDEAAYNITARVTGLPFFEEGRYLHLGGSYTHQFRGGSATASYDARPESDLADKLVDTGSIPTHGQDILGLEGALIWGPFSLQSEFISSWVDRDRDRDGGGNPFFWGVYAQASYFLTGESRPFDTFEGVFGRVHPEHDFNPGKRHWGAWEVAARYSYLDLDSASIRGGILGDVTLGLNWYLYPNFRWMLNYVYSHLNGAGDSNVAEMRFQVDY